MSRLSTQNMLPMGTDPILRRSLDDTFTRIIEQLNVGTVIDNEAITGATTIGKTVTLVDPSATGSVTVTLVPAIEWEDRVMYIRHVAKSGAVKVVAQSGELIDGSATYGISPSRSLALISDGSGWHTAASGTRTGPLTAIDFGAIGDGVADDTDAVNAAVAQALSVGTWLDGGGLTYGVTGTISIGSGAKIRNAGFKQLAPSVSETVTTLHFTNALGVKLEGIKVDRNGGQDHGLNASASIESSYAIRIDGNGAAQVGDYCTVTDIEVTGGDSGSMLWFNDINNLTVTRVIVHDCYALYQDTQSDDRIQGLWFNNCKNFTVTDCHIRNMGVNQGAGNVKERSRAIAVGGCSDFTITGCHVTDCDQSYDLTGSLSNQRFVISGCHATRGWSWGFKFASAHHGVIRDCIANQCAGGFVVSGRSERVQPDSEEIDFIQCISYDPTAGNPGMALNGFSILDMDASHVASGGDSLVFAATGKTLTYVPGGVASLFFAKLNSGNIFEVTGSVSNNRYFKLDGNPTTAVATLIEAPVNETITSGTVTFQDGSAPVNIRFIECSAYDTTGNMERGFQNGVRWPTAGGYAPLKLNEAIRCRSDAATTQKKTGFYNPALSLYSNVQQTITTSTLTPIDWRAAYYDETNWHNPNSDNRLILIQRDGLYQINVQISLEAIAGGSRRLYLTSGGVTQEGRQTYTIPNTSVNNIISMSFLFRVVDVPAAGKDIDFRVWQDSGGDVLTKTDATLLTIHEVQQYAEA